MKLINVTNSHSRLVMQQLENTDAEMVRVYTAGNTTVIYTEAPLHNEILLVNKKRAISPFEIDEIKTRFLKRMPSGSYDAKDISILNDGGVVEISIPKAPKELLT
ncbi:MAG TPA: DUF1827 family protein [Candidatus Tetragenococcus pullicola]|nr:DUF1827 family protein [Candidatus Tetragenococcus pullicola]